MESALNSVWTKRPDVVRNYYDLLPIHQRLCDEVRYILEKQIKSNGIEIGHLNARAKTLASFCEKIDRKKYQNPFDEITDLSGVRLVYLYASDKSKLEKLIEEEFDIHEKVDKISDQGVERFGYGALHYIVSIKEQHAGARYDDLRSVRCEVQVRTILQDAWAIVAHHLSYKHEQDIPDELKRKLHALSGLFETADDQFENINHARQEYQIKLKKSIEINSVWSLEAEVNLDSLIAYMSWKFPNRNISEVDAAADLLEELKTFGYKTLKSIDEAVARSWDAILAYEEKYPPAKDDDDDDDDSPSIYKGVGLIRTALLFVDPAYLKTRNFYGMAKRYKEFANLIK